MKSKRRLSKRTKKTKKRKDCYKVRKSIYGGGHPHQDLPHYHLYIQFPSGRTTEMEETFLRSEKSRGVKSVTVGDIEDYVRRLFREWEIADRPFTLFFKGKKLDNSNVKLRRIIVDGKKIRPYASPSDEIIIVKFNDTIDDISGIQQPDIEIDDDTPEFE